MAYVGHIDWSFADRPGATGPTSSGLARNRIVGPEQGAIHTDLAVGALAPGGWIAPHVHSYEEALYVLGGELLLDLGARRGRAEAEQVALVAKSIDGKMPTYFKTLPRLPYGLKPIPAEIAPGTTTALSDCVESISGTHSGQVAGRTIR